MAAGRLKLTADANWDDWWGSPASCSSSYRSAMKEDHNNYCLCWAVDRGCPANAAESAAPLHYDSRTFTPISKLENNSLPKTELLCSNYQQTSATKDKGKGE